MNNENHLRSGRDLFLFEKLPIHKLYVVLLFLGHRIGHFNKQK